MKIEKEFINIIAQTKSKMPRPTRLVIKQTLIRAVEPANLCISYVPKLFH